MVALLYHVEESVGHRDVAVFGDAGDYVIVGKIVVIIVVAADVKETVTFQTERLMYLEVEAN